MVTIDHLRELGHKSGVPVVGEEIMFRLFNIEDIKPLKKSLSIIILALFEGMSWNRLRTDLINKWHITHLFYT